MFASIAMASGNGAVILFGSTKMCVCVCVYPHICAFVSLCFAFMNRYVCHVSVCHMYTCFP